VENVMKNRRSPLGLSPAHSKIELSQLVQNIRNHLGITFDAMAALGGVAHNTILNWANGSKSEQIEALFRLLARLPEGLRHHLVDEACPTFPSLDHRHIARDRIVRAELLRLLEKSSGATLVTSPSDYLRSFVATALAHTFATRKPNRILVSGYDIHDASPLVPVLGVRYLDVAQRPNHLESLFRQLPIPRAPLVLLNGVVFRHAELLEEALRASANSHVVMAEAAMDKKLWERFAEPRHVVRVSPCRDCPSHEDEAAHMKIDVSG
jgi:transcriptional regulator with XRE-family HTH domain